MSKHVSLRSSEPRSLTYFYCVDGQPVYSGGPFCFNFLSQDEAEGHIQTINSLVLALPTLPDNEVFAWHGAYAKLLSLALTPFLNEDIALTHLMYLLRLVTVLKYYNPEVEGDNRLRWAQYLGRRPYTCCSRTSSGGLARGKNDAS